MMTLPEGVRYAILRNNVEIPLIPADQLPFQLQGLPRRLEPSQHDEEGWSLVGDTQQPALMFSLRVSSELHPNQQALPMKGHFLSPDHDACRNKATMARISQSVPSESQAPLISQHRISRTPERALSRRPIAYSTDRSALIQSSIDRTSKTPGPEPDPLKKEYCTHWIRHNSCDFMQQGCRYKHEMPDREKLKELGFPSVPMWYRDKIAICAGSSNWIRSRNTQTCDERSLSTEPIASRHFRPLAAAQRPVQSLVTRVPEQPGFGMGIEPAHIPNLIDLDEPFVEAMSLVRISELAQSTAATSHEAAVTNVQPSDQLIGTFGSSRREVTEPFIDKNGVSDHFTPQSSVSSLRRSNIQNASTSPSISQVHQKTGFDQMPAKDAEKPNNKLSGPGHAGQSIIHPLSKIEAKNTKAKTRKERIRSSQTKCAECSIVPDTQSGLGKSQYAVAAKPKHQRQ